jgi:hypothetical protein
MIAIRLDTTPQQYSGESSRSEADLTNAGLTSCDANGLPPLPSWTLHDLRRTMVTVMNEPLAIQPHVVEAVGERYIRAWCRRCLLQGMYLDNRRAALLAWQEYILRLLACGCSKGGDISN